MKDRVDTEAGCYKPSATEIRRCCWEIQATWSEREEIKRRMIKNDLIIRIINTGVNELARHELDSWQQECQMGWQFSGGKWA